MILQGDPAGAHVWTHVNGENVLRIGMGFSKENNLAEITFTGIAEERLWRLLTERREIAMQQIPTFG